MRILKNMSATLIRRIMYTVYYIILVIYCIHSGYVIFIYVLWGSNLLAKRSYFISVEYY